MKIDLHLHLDGSLRPYTVWELAEEQKITLPVESKEELASLLQVSEDCQSLNEYLKCFDLPLLVLQKPEALERVTFELIEDLALQGVTYAEIRFAPQLSIKSGMSIEEAVKAAIQGLKKGLTYYPAIQAGLILCYMRGAENQLLNKETLMVAKKYYGKEVLAVDLAGAEALFPTTGYEELFQETQKAGVPFTIHAGEADGAGSVRKAIEFGAKRIGHGIRAIEDEHLIKQIIKENIVLEVCPISNFHTKLATEISKYPIRELFDMGVHITINTDNRTVSHTSLDREYAFIKKYYHFTEQEIVQMNEYAKEGAFLTYEESSLLK